MELRFTQDDKHFTYGARAVIIEDGCVLMVSNTGMDFYYPVGGGAYHGETAQEAVLREALEETGAEYEIDRLLFVHENIFMPTGIPRWEGLFVHEVAFYFLMKQRGSKDVVCESYGGEFKESLHWLPIEDLRSYKLYPEFLYDKIADLPQGVEHIVSRTP